MASSGGTLDHARFVVALVPCCAFAGSLAKGLSGMGEGIVFTALWQVACVAGVPEADDVHLCATLVCIMQCWNILSMAWYEHRQWGRYLRASSIAAVFMSAMSPVGSFWRESMPTHTVTTAFAVLFLCF